MIVMAQEEDYSKFQDDEDISDDDTAPEAHNKLLKAVSQLYKKQRIEAPKRREPAQEISEFHLSSNTEENANKLRVDDLLKDLKEKVTHKEITKKVKAAQSKSRTLPKPLEKKEADKISRQAGYKNVKDKLDRWNSIVERNRLASQLVFPLQQKQVANEAPNFLTTFKEQTELEKAMAEILNKSEVAQEERKIEESLSHLSIEEMIERRNMIAKMRARESYRIAKAVRQNKIKSKSYHRLLKKERIKQELKDFEKLQQTDPEAALAKLEQIEKARAEERISLRHRNTGKWAKSQAIRAKYNTEARAQLAEQLAKSRELTRKVRVESSSSEGEIEEDEPGDEVVTKISSTGLKQKETNNPWMKEFNDFVSGFEKFESEQKKLSQKVEESAVSQSSEQEKLSQKVEESTAAQSSEQIKFNSDRDIDSTSSESKAASGLDSSHLSSKDLMSADSTTNLSQSFTGCTTEKENCKEKDFFIGDCTVSSSSTSTDTMPSSSKQTYLNNETEDHNKKASDCLRTKNLTPKKLSFSSTTVGSSSPSKETNVSPPSEGTEISVLTKEPPLSKENLSTSLRPQSRVNLSVSFNTDNSKTESHSIVDSNKITSPRKEEIEIISGRQSEENEMVPGRQSEHNEVIPVRQSEENELIPGRQSEENELIPGRQSEENEVSVVTGDFLVTPKKLETSSLSNKVFSPSKKSLSPKKHNDREEVLTPEAAKNVTLNNKTTPKKSPTMDVTLDVLKPQDASRKRSKKKLKSSLTKSNKSKEQNINLDKSDYEYDSGTLSDSCLGETEDLCTETETVTTNSGSWSVVSETSPSNNKKSKKNTKLKRKQSNNAENVLNNKSTKIKNKSKEVVLNEMFDGLEEAIQNRTLDALNKIKADLNEEKAETIHREKKSKDLLPKARRTQNIRGIDEALLELHEEGISSGLNDLTDIKSKIMSSGATNSTSNKEAQIDPNKHINVKPQKLLSGIGTIEEAGDDDDSDEENNKQKMDLMEAFAEDDIAEQFRKEKDEESKNNKAEKISLDLPGWGSWGGTSIPQKTMRKRRRLLFKLPQVPRKDQKKDNVIINEDPVPKLRQQLVNELPYPYTSVKDFEASLRAPIGKNWVPETAHKKLIAPPVVTRMGTIIQPICDESVVSSDIPKKMRRIK